MGAPVDNLVLAFSPSLRTSILPTFDMQHAYRRLTMVGSSVEKLVAQVNVVILIPSRSRPSCPYNPRSEAAIRLLCKNMALTVS